MRNLTTFTKRKTLKPLTPVQRFTVEPRLPDNLQPLKELSLNLYWSWNHECRELFRRIDMDAYESSGHNPYKMLGILSQKKFAELARDEAFLAYLERVYQDFKVYMATSNTWFQGQCSIDRCECFAYFSAEYGITECVPIYSGGLGVLSGDHLKSASDLGVPLVGVGLLYQEGYFRQYLSADGWQQEEYPVNDFYTLPITKARRSDGSAVTIDVGFPGRRVFAQVWRAEVGRVPLYLLDTNIEANAHVDRDVTDELYGGDRETRIQQEILLGIGGVRALDALDYQPTSWHMNEGHSAFMGLERIRILMKEHGLSFDEAREIIRGGSVFTTHTPVPAGIDRFAPQLMEKYFSEYWTELGLEKKSFLALGREKPDDENEPFNMAILAFNLSGLANGVSKLHGKVSRRMWQFLWPEVHEDEVPIKEVTNGVHCRSWVSIDMAELFDRYLGPRWYEEPPGSDIWKKVEHIPPVELWRTHDRRRERLVAFARRRLRTQLEQRGAPPAEIEEAGEVLDPNALTIGFARRFATYKRGSLIFKDVKRLARILNDPRRPVQIIFAGKAHPKDNPGKEIISEIVNYARQEQFRGRIVFLEDYDLSVVRYMVQGVDVWANNPRRYQEASGTSGMKAAVNGALNMSILDGWWDEAYNPDLGWAIGKGEVYEDYEYQDMVESRAIYTVLEKDIVPLFYERGSDGIPRKWVAKMKKSMDTLIPQFTTDRMVGEYTDDYYIESTDRSAELEANDFEMARQLAAWRNNTNANWEPVRVLAVKAEGTEKARFAEEITVRAQVRLGELTPEDVAVEAVHGMVTERGVIENPMVSRMEYEDSTESSVHHYRVTFKCEFSGNYGYTVRIRPFHKALMTKPSVIPVHWADIESGESAL